MMGTPLRTSVARGTSKPSIVATRDNITSINVAAQRCAGMCLWLHLREHLELFMMAGLLRKLWQGIEVQPLESSVGCMESVHGTQQNRRSAPAHLRRIIENVPAENPSSL
jgi:hypothetical protein